MQCMSNSNFLHLLFQIKKRIMKTLENTVFAGVRTVAVAARPGASEVTIKFFPAFLICTRSNLMSLI